MVCHLHSSTGPPYYGPSLRVGFSCAPLVQCGLASILVYPNY
jgi:hypothetical protein